MPTLYAEVLKAAEDAKGEAGGAQVLRPGGRSWSHWPGTRWCRGQHPAKEEHLPDPGLFDYARGRDIILDGRR